MGKMRVHELAKELGKENKDILEALEGLGVQVSSHMSTVDEEVCEKIKKKLKRKTGQKKRENRKRRILFRYSARRTARPAWSGRDSGPERQDPASQTPGRSQGSHKGRGACRPQSRKETGRPCEAPGKSGCFGTASAGTGEGAEK